MPLQTNEVPDSGKPSSDDLSARLSQLSPAQRKLLTRRLAKRGSEATEQPSENSPSDHRVADDTIVIVGMGCRLPGAADPDRYWDLIRRHRQAIADVPPERWDQNRFYDATGRSPGKMSVNKIAPIDQVDRFDPAFFGIAPREAARMDPQQRLLLEVVWETFENAGIPAESLAGSRTGVFIGIGGTDYSKVPSQYPDYFEQIDAHIGTGNALSIAAGRISYLFDLRGPSFIVDTACSSALVAIHNAAASLRNGESDAAIAGGVNLILTPETTIAFSKARMLSPDGDCRPFDHAANGYVRGEGCGLVLLKRMSDATRDGDRLLGIIRGTAVNQDGRTSGITAPSGQAQVAVIRDALAAARLTPDQISYVEAHGTGTPLGDPIELAALDQVFAGRSPTVGPVRVGSVKGNIGHTETVSGIAGLLKVLQMFRHRQFPAQPNFKKLNENIRLDEKSIRVLEHDEPWRDEAATPRIAGVSSFGFGGTNAHLIVQQPPSVVAGTTRHWPPNGRSITAATAKGERTGNGSAENSSAHPPARPEVLLLSARDPQALQALAGRYADRVADADAATLHDLAGSTAIHRSALSHRLALIDDQAFAERPGENLARRFRSIARQETIETTADTIHGRPPSGRRTRVAMVFTGQGSQYAGMGRRLLQTCGDFRTAIASCAKVLDPLLGAPLQQILLGEAGDLNHTSLAQPAIVAIQCALVDALKAVGIRPDVVAGHSIGEIAALYAGQAFDLKQALTLAARRGRVMGDLPVGGTMAAVLCAAEQVQDFIEQSGSAAVIAAMNGPEATVVAGDVDDVDSVTTLAARAGVATRRLDVSHAFHSPRMQPAVASFQDDLDSLLGRAGLNKRVRFISSLHGEIHEQPVDVDYWLRHLVSPVRFTEVMNRLAEETTDLTIEIGPRPQLLGMIGRVNRNRPPADRQANPALTASILDAEGRDHAGWLRTLAAAWCVGAPVDWRAVYRSRPFRRVDLPGYPFQRSRYWYDPPAFSGGGHRGPQVHPLLGSGQNLAVGGTVYSATLRETSPPYLADHVVGGSITVPGAAWVEAITVAAERAMPAKPVGLQDIRLHKPVFLAAGKSVSVQTHVSPVVGGRCQIRIATRQDAEGDQAEWQICATATATASIDSDDVDAWLADFDGEDELSRCTPSSGPESSAAEISPANFYEQAGLAGLTYEPFFQTLKSIRVAGTSGAGTLQLDDALAGEAQPYRLHPTMLDGALQLIGAVVHQSAGRSDETPVALLPASVSRLRFGSSRESIHSVRIRLTRSGDKACADVVLRDRFERLVAVLDQVTLKSLRRPAKAFNGDVSPWLHRTDWTISRIDSPSTAAAFCWPAENESPRNERDDDAALSGLRKTGGDDPHWIWVQPEMVDGDDIAATTHRRCLDLTKALQSALDRRPLPRFSIITRAAFVTGLGDRDRVDPVAAALAGLARSAANECPQLRIRHLDVDRRDADAALAIADWLCPSSTDETELAWRDGQAFAPRLRVAPGDLTRTDDRGGLATPRRGEYRIRLDGTHRTEGLWAQRMPMLHPIGDEVRVRIAAVGLNFSDVLKSMGLYPGITDQVVPLGIEVCGVVEAVGPKTKRLTPGMRVMGVVPHGFASSDKTNEYLLTPIPAGLRDEEAAGIPIVFLTAHHALLKVGRLAAGERVLIHAGAGGVGLAAIQIALTTDAIVYSTAGSDAKRRLLRQSGVPEENIFDSRDLESIGRIRRQSGGVDVVLNSLPGPWIDQSLGLLRPHGRFLEIGKVDIYNNHSLGLLPFQDNLSYSAIDLDRWLRQRPDDVRRMYDEVTACFTNGTYQPLPITSFSLGELPAALRYMAARRNIGKVVVTPPKLDDDIAMSAGTHLITGGSGAIGMAVARRLIQRGASSVDLIGRRRTDDQIKELIRWALEYSGASICYHQADVTDRESLRAIVKLIRRRGEQIVGVVHAAGVLEDGLLPNQNEASLRRVLQPKVDGAMALHQATETSNLSYFTMLGSVANVFGSPGQTNYAAANGFLEGLAEQRRIHGQPATVVHWGPWDNSGGGMASDDATQKNVLARGLRPLDFDAAVDLLLDSAGDDDRPAACVAVDADWRKMLPGGVLPPSRLRELGEASTDAATTDGGGPDEAFLSRLKDAESDDVKLTLLRGFLADRLAKIMGMSAESIDPAQALGSLGLDSLMAIELKNTIESKLNIELPISRFVDEPSLETLAESTLESLS